MLFTLRDKSILRQGRVVQEEWWVNFGMRSARGAARERKIMSYYIGTDIGGTFTDLVMLSDAGDIAIVKAPTTPEDRTRGVLDALELAASDLGIDAKELVADLLYFAHGTTAATNEIGRASGRERAETP